MLFFLINVLPIGEIQHPFGIRNVFNVSFRFRFVKPHKISTYSAHSDIFYFHILYPLSDFELKFCKVSWNSFSNRWWKFQLSILKNKKREFQQMALAVPIFSEGFDISINLDCTYDGGDWCGSNVNTDWSTECQCLEGVLWHFQCFCPLYNWKET